MRNRLFFGAVLSVLLSAFAAPARAQPEQEKLETTKLADGLYLITGPGGNIALSVGNQGVLLVDDQVQPMNPQLKKAVAAVTPKPVRLVFNTHWHGDHTGGNGAFAADGAVVVAQDNVRKRMSSEQFMEMFKRKIPASPEAALPIVTFADSLALHVNGDDIAIFHADPAHTDGDSVVQFKKANVIHMGDTYTSAGYPFIDLSSGGTVDGFVRTADRVISLAQPTTKIIPGHGPVTDKAKLKVYRDMIVTIRDRVKKLVAEGKSLDQVQAAKPSAEFDAAWGGAFIKGSQLVETIYKDVAHYSSNTVWVWA